MLIGIDASRSEVKDKTGTENYSSELIKAMLALPEARKHSFRLYKKMTRLDLVSKQGPTFLEEKAINWPRLWTQGGLALETWKRSPEVLWIPAHTLPVLRKPGIKTVVTIHGLEYEFLPEYYQFPQRLWLNKATEYAVKQADKLIAVSNWTKKQLVEKLGADPGKISVVYEGVSYAMPNVKCQMSNEYRRQIHYKYSLPKEYILFVGTIQPRKNLARLIEAFAKMISIPGLKNFPNRECGLVIVGKKGWMADEIYAAPKKFGVEKQVKFIGRVADSELAAIYRDARLFIYPSLMEGFGLPVLEAMASGIPVVTSNRGALPEVVENAGLLVDPENTQEIAQAMKLVLENEELREALIEKGFRQVKKFSWDKAAKQTLDILTNWE